MKLPTQSQRDTIRQDAIDNRDPIYADGYPCTVGHISGRYTLSTSCVECIDESVRNQRGKGRPSIIAAIKRSNKPSTIRARENAEHFTESMLLNTIRTHQLKVVKIKRRKVLTIEQYMEKHKIDEYEGPMNGPYTFD